VLILEVEAVGAAVEAQRHQTPIPIHSVAVDSVTVGPHLIPLLRALEAEAEVEVIVLRRQMLHQMQVQTLLEEEVVLHYLHLKLKAARTTITMEDLIVVDQVSVLHALEALLHLL
jgi:hypothetical protein